MLIARIPLTLASSVPIVDPRDGTQYQHGADGSKSLLDSQYWYVRVKEPTRERQ